MFLKDKFKLQTLKCNLNNSPLLKDTYKWIRDFNKKKRKEIKKR